PSPQSGSTRRRARPAARPPRPPRGSGRRSPGSRRGSRPNRARGAGQARRRATSPRTSGPDGRQLNDSLVDFFLGVLVHRSGGGRRPAVCAAACKVPPPCQHTTLGGDRRAAPRFGAGRVHLFGSHFYSRLTSFGARSGEEGWENVSRWTRSARRADQRGIFSKDYLLLPINVNAAHWVLAVVCHPWAGASREPGGPLVAVLDSLGACDEVREEVVRFLGGYLAREWGELGGDDDFDRGSVIGCAVQVPEQDNDTDCGIYVLEFALRLLACAGALEQLARGAAAVRAHQGSGLAMRLKVPAVPRRRWRVAASLLQSAAPGADDSVLDLLVRQWGEDVCGATSCQQPRASAGASTDTS
ncbi:unnamed protein product, partial [Prorocentrum cordatum]